MRRWILPGAIVIALTALSMMVFSAPQQIGAWPPGMGWMMPGGIMGGFGGWGFRPAIIQPNPGATDIKAWLGRLIAISGNPHIKVGSVTATDANTFTAEIVTTDREGLVERFSIDRTTGIIRPEGNQR